MSKFPADLFPFPVAPVVLADFVFLGLVPYAANQLLAFFSIAPVSDDPEGFDSVTNRINWTVVAVDPRIPRVADPNDPFLPPGEAVPTYTPEIGLIEVDDDDDKQIHISFNTRLEERVRYQLTASLNIRTANCDELEDPRTREAQGLFIGTGPTPRFITQDTLRDFDLRYFPTDPLQPNGTWRYDTTGDIGIQSEDESLRKRILRRVSTSPRGFVNLSRDYGAGLNIKTLARSGRIQDIANVVAEQARQEPDVRDAGAEARLAISPDGTAILNLSVRVVRVGRRESQFTLDVPLTTTGA